MSFIAWLKKHVCEDDAWITVHPNASGPGSPVLLDDEGYIKGGMGGKFTGQRIDLMPRKSGYGVPVSENDPLNNSTPGFLRTERYNLRAPKKTGMQAAKVLIGQERTDSIEKLKEKYGSINYFHSKIDQDLRGFNAEDVERVHAALDGYREKNAEKIGALATPEDEKIQVMSMADEGARYEYESKIAEAKANHLISIGTSSRSESVRSYRAEAERLSNQAKIQQAVIDAYVATKLGEYNDTPEKLGGAKRGTPMTHQQANEGNANPDMNKQGGLNNCQSCVAAYEMRLRGYDVKAGLNIKGSSQYALSRDPRRAWVDKETGLPPESRIVKGTNMDELVDGLRTELKNGERYNVMMHWSYGGGHITTATKNSNGEVEIYDPQIGKTFRTTAEIKRQYDSLFDYNSGMEYYRVDNLAPNVDVMNAVLKRGNKA